MIGIYGTIEDEDAGVRYLPWSKNGVAGFLAIDADGNEEYIYLNPSGGSDDGVPNVFLYIGPHGDPSMDQPVHHYDLFEG